MTKFKIKNALVSLTDKNKIEIVAKKLKELDINIISTGGTAKYLKSHSIDVIDITGAGDAFTAGLIHQLVKNSSSKLNSSKVKEMVGFAAACGALVCEGTGAIEPQPTQSQVYSFLGADLGVVK